MKRTLGIRAYFGLSHASLLIISLGAIAFIWVWSEYRVITRELQEQMQARAALIANFVGHEFAEYGEGKIDTTELPLSLKEETEFAVFIDNTGALHELIPGTVSPRQESLFLDLHQTHHVYTDTLSMLVETGPGSTSIYAAAPVEIPGQASQGSIGVVCLLQPLGGLETYIHRLRWLLLGAIGVAALLGIGISFLLANVFSRQFSRAQRLAATVADGNFEQRIPEAGPTELRNLTRYLNRMAEELEENRAARQLLLANVAHELARPLGGLLLGIESLRKGAVEDPELADDLLVDMRQTIYRLESTVDDITLAALPEAQKIKLERRMVAVKPFIQGVVTRFWSPAESLGVHLETSFEEDLPHFYADEKRLNQIMGNLVDNAIKFSPFGGTVLIRAERTANDQIRLSVEDQGAGISSEEIEHVFEAFYQGSRGRMQKQGMGLGLPIARQLALAHGGSLDLENLPGGGLAAILVLPSVGSGS